MKQEETYKKFLIISRSTTIHNDTEIIFLSQAYHNIGNRFMCLINEFSGEYEKNTSFLSIESLGIDLKLITDTLRFTSKNEIIQGLVILTRTLLGKLLYKGEFKIESKLYDLMSALRKRIRSKLSTHSDKLLLQSLKNVLNSFASSTSFSNKASTILSKILRFFKIRRLASE